MTTRENRCDVLNFVRFLAMLSVFLLHSVIFTPFDWSKGVPSHAWLIYTPAWAGVWVFFILSGYGIGYGFYSGKYNLTYRGVVEYWFSRIFKIIPMYYLFLAVVIVFFCPERLLPSRENVKNIFSLLLFDYSESFGSLEFGAVWYLSTLMKLYIVAPFGYYLARRYFATSRKVIWVVLCLCVGSIVFRLFWWYHFRVNNYDNWSALVYKPFYMNLDLFFCGFYINRFRGMFDNMRFARVLKVVSVVALVALVVINSYIYWYGVYRGVRFYVSLYQYVFPTVYLVVVLSVIVFCDLCRGYEFEPLSVRNLVSNPVRAFDCFAKIVMPFYLFHSAVLRQIQAVLRVGYDDYILRVDGILNLVGVGFGDIDFVKHVLATGLSFVLTALISTVLYIIIRDFDGKPIAWRVCEIFSIKIYRR